MRNLSLPFMPSRASSRLVSSISYRQVRGTVASLRSLLDEVERLLPATGEGLEGDEVIAALIAQSGEELARLGLTLLQMVSGLGPGASPEEQREAVGLACAKQGEQRVA